MKKSEQQLDNILSFLDSYISSNGFSPSYREISEGVKLKSTNSVKEYLDILEQRNLIKRQPTKNRTIEIVGKNKTEVVNLPIIGQVAAGQPILAEQNIEDFVSISSSFFGVNDSNNKLFILKVKGDSMIEVGINDGDYVVSRSQNVANNGEIVVAMIDGNATVKTFYKEENQIRLQPANSNYSPIYSTEVQLLGKVVGVIRRM
jgi:repressor LexA